MKQFRWVLLFVVVATSLPFWLITDNYLQTLAFNILIFAALGLAWNIIGGFAGQLAFGNAAFFGIGAYVVAIGGARYGINPYIGMLIAGLLASVVAAGLGYVCFRLRGIYFALSTFVFMLILGLLTRHFISFTGGDIGTSVQYLGHAPLQFQFDSRLPYYFIALAFVSAYLLLCYFIKNSKFGYYLNAIRNDQEAAESLGVNSMITKIYAFMISAFLTALIGGLYVQSYLLIEPETAFGLNTAVNILLVVIAGGIGTIWGPVIGSVVINSLAEVANHFFGAIAGIDVVVYAVCLILIVKFLPEGLIKLPGLIKSNWIKSQKQRSKKEEAA